MTYKNIKLWIAGQPLPFTEISGNRPVLFNFDKQTSANDFIEKVNQLKQKYNFKLVDKNHFNFIRTSLVSGNITLNSEIYTKFDYNYCIIEIENEILLYFINHIKVIQNNANLLDLKLDTISTYFWKLNINNQIGVDRLTYKDNYKLSQQTLKVKDDSIGNIVKSLSFIKNGGNCNIIPLAYNIPTSNDIEKIKEYKQFPYLKGYVTILENLHSFGLEENSNNQYINFILPMKKKLIIYNKNFIEEYDINKIRVVGNHDLSIYHIISTLVQYNVTHILNFDIYYDNLLIKHFKGKVNLSYIEEDFVDIPGAGDFDMSLTDFISKFSIIKYDFWDELKKLLDVKTTYQFYNVLIAQSPLSNAEYNIELPKLYNLPMIPELIEINIISWCGDILPISYYYFVKDNYLKFNYYGMPTMNEYKTYISLYNNKNSSLGTSFRNIYDFRNSKTIQQRYDNKVEYLAQNANQIELEKKMLTTNMGFNIADNTLSLAKNFTQGIAGLPGIANNFINYAKSIINYKNKIRTIDARIEDVGNSRSVIKGGETGEFNFITNNDNLKYFDENGISITIRIPDEYMLRKLIYHFKKYGYKLDTLLSLENIIKESEKYIKENHFTYIKLYDTSQLYNGVSIPQEIIEWIDDLLLSGVHFWDLNSDVNMNFIYPKLKPLSGWTLGYGKDDIINKEKEII